MPVAPTQPKGSMGGEREPVAAPAPPIRERWPDVLLVADSTFRHMPPRCLFARHIVETITVPGGAITMPASGHPRGQARPPEAQSGMWQLGERLQSCGGRSRALRHAVVSGSNWAPNPELLEAYAGVSAHIDAIAAASEPATLALPGLAALQCAQGPEGHLLWEKQGKGAHYRDHAGELTVLDELLARCAAAGMQGVAQVDGLGRC